MAVLTGCLSGVCWVSHQSSSSLLRQSIVEHSHCIGRLCTDWVRSWCCHTSPLMPEPAEVTQSPVLGAFLASAGSLWHKDRWLPCSMHGIYYKRWSVYVSFLPGVLQSEAEQERQPWPPLISVTSLRSEASPAVRPRPTSLQSWLGLTNGEAESGEQSTNRA